MRFNLLIITDHLSHTASNSVYALAKTLRQDAACRSAWICSRGVEANRNFFNSIPGSNIMATPITSDFQFDQNGFWFYNGLKELSMKDIDVVLIRMPQPADIVFLQSLDNFFPDKIMINQPRGILETSIKSFLLNVRQLCPSLLLCKTMDDAMRLSDAYEIVLKPLFSYRGKGLIRLSANSIWKENEQFPFESFREVLQENQFPMLAMRFMKNVVLGDKRTIVINKKNMGSAIRLPQPGHWICNVAQGGHPVLSAPDEDELIIESILTPLLYEKGIVMYGFDTLVNDEGRRVLSEINTLSIGGLMPLQEMSGRPVVEEAAKEIWEYVKGRGHFDSVQ